MIIDLIQTNRMTEEKSIRNCFMYSCIDINCCFFLTNLASKPESFQQAKLPVSEVNAKNVIF